MEAQNLLDKVLAELDKMVSTKRIVGEPVTFEGKTIIPVMKVGVGYGGAGGSGEGKDPKSAAAGSGTGGGAGAGASMEPVALIVIDKEDVNVYPISSKKGISSIIETIADKAPELMEKGMELQAKKEKETE